MRAMGSIFVVENWFLFRMCVMIYSFINNIIIYHDFLPPPRRGSHFKSDNTHTMINTHPLAHKRDTRDLIFSSCAPFTVYPNLIMPRHYTPLQVITNRRAVRKNTVPSINGRVKLIQLHMYQGSPLFPIFRALSSNLHHHSSVAQGHLHTIHPA